MAAGDRRPRPTPEGGGVAQLREEPDRSGPVSRRSFGTLIPLQVRTRIENWLWDLGGRVALNDRIAREAYNRVAGREDGRDPRRHRDPLPRLLDQTYAAGERHWHVRMADQTYRAHIRATRGRQVRFRSYATTVTPPRWMVPEDRFDAAHLAGELVRWRKQAQRWARALPADSFVCGAIDATLVVDQQHRLRHWSFHLHLLIMVPARTRRQGRDLIRRAFSVKARKDLGVSRPVVSKRIRGWKGGARGWLRYGDKALQIHAVHRRTVPFNPVTGKRGEPRKQHLTFEELAPWADLLSRIRADDLIVWVGYRRRGDEVTPAAS